MTTTASLTRQWAEESAQDVVPANRKAIKRSKTVNLGLLSAAIACTYWHQAHYLSGIEGFGMPIGDANINLGYIAPLIWDVAMISNANTLQTTAMAETAKRRAIVMMLAAGAISMAVNLIAPGAWMARALFAVLVGIAVGQKWAGAAIKPNFKALEGLETEAATQATPVEVKPEPKRCADDCTCRRHARNRQPVRTPRPPRQRKPATAKTTTHATFERELLDMIRDDEAVRPVSPAPTGR